MKVKTISYIDGIPTVLPGSDQLDDRQAQLVLVFGRRRLLDPNFYLQQSRHYPAARIVLCSTSGEIYNHRVQDNSISVTVIQFAHTTLAASVADIAGHGGNSFDTGVALVKALPFSDDLCHILVFCDGSVVNGSQLIRGVESIVQHRVPVTGGLAGDGVDFSTTVVGLDTPPAPGKVVAIAFYSTSLTISHGTMGGYEMFGPEITVTSSVDNKLYGINDQNALDLYKKYLGPYAAGLPSSALLFPLSVKLDDGHPPVVRTILSIDAREGCMIFAGDVPQGSRVRFMKANFDKLIDAAGEAAAATLKSLVGQPPKLALLISCVGRKIILDCRIDEEIEAIRDVYQGRTLLAGFYSYGEICPFSPGSPTELHNQTMTITTFDEP